MLAPSAIIGERLREIRMSLELSLDEAARLTGVSKPMLGQIERGRSTPTVTTLWKIATGLKTPLSAFLQERQPEYTVIDVRGAEPVSACEGGMLAYTVFPYDPIRNTEVFFIEFSAGCRHVSARHNDGVEEYVMVLSGRLQLVINGKEVLVCENQAIRFRADVPHAYNVPFPEGCTAYNIIFYPGR